MLTDHVNVITFFTIYLLYRDNHKDNNYELLTTEANKFIEWRKQRIMERVGIAKSTLLPQGFQTHLSTHYNFNPSSQSIRCIILALEGTDATRNQYSYFFKI